MATRYGCSEPPQQVTPPFKHCQAASDEALQIVEWKLNDPVSRGSGLSGQRFSVRALSSASSSNTSSHRACCAGDNRPRITTRAAPRSESS